MSQLRWLPRFRRAYREAGLLQAREGWSRAEVEAFQLDRLNALWRHAVAHVPHYRQLAARAKLPAGFCTLEEFRATVPVLPKEVVRESPTSVLSEHAERGGWSRTGGSTGTPMSAYWGKAAELEMLRAKYRWQAAWGVDIFDRTAYLWGHSASVKPGLAGWAARRRQPVEDRLRNRLRLSAYDLGRETLRGYLRRLGRFRPVMLYGYSRALALLAQEAEAGGFRCDSLRLAVLTGEPAFPALIETIERAFRVPAVVEYGSVECGLLAGETPDRALRVREDLVYLETQPRDDGRHDILVTMLTNPSFPLLRYAIGDVTDAPIERPDRGFARLHNVAGRNNDLVVSRTGRHLHSARFDALFKYETAAVRRFRVRQHADGTVAVAVELTDAAARFDPADVRRRVGELVEGYPVTIEVVDVLPQTAAGKHRLVCSDLDAALAPPRRTARPSPDPIPAALTDTPLPAAPAAQRQAPLTKPARLRRLLHAPELSFLMEAHNGLSARVAEEAGFEGLWASGLSISAALGVRDSNEASWTQVLEVLEFMCDATRVPILVDGDTGHGNFNNMRRFVRKLEQRGVAGVCIEDKVFPKTNSFINGTAQPLADVDEFCGRIKAGKDAQADPDFVVVARVEAFIAGWGLGEALRRAEAYRRAGADAILIHSALRTPHEILAFKEEWGDRLPVVIVPTKYYATPTDVFRRHGFAAAIWANHLMRSCITAMQRTAQQVFEEQHLQRVEDRVAPLAEVFRLQGARELEDAEKRYLPKDAGRTRAVVLAAARGAELGDLTLHRPKCMVDVVGQPLLAHVAAAYRAAGVKDLVAVRGYKKDAVTVPGLRYVDHDDADATGEAYSLFLARDALDGPCVVSDGDVLFKKYIAEELVDCPADFAVVVDASGRDAAAAGRPGRYVACSADSPRAADTGPVTLRAVAQDVPTGGAHAEWTGFLKTSAEGSRVLRSLLDALAADLPRLRAMSGLDLLRELLQAGHEVRVVYTAGHWLDVDTLDDVLAAGRFQ